MRGSEPGAGADDRRRAAWTFLSNHARVLACLASDPSIRLRDVAAEVGITERAAQSIVADLVSSGSVTRTRIGRRNRYEVHHEAPLREAKSTSTVGDLLDFLRSGNVAVSTVRFTDELQTVGAGNGHGNGAH